MTKEEFYKRRSDVLEYIENIQTRTLYSDDLEYVRTDTSFSAGMAYKAALDLLRDIAEEYIEIDDGIYPSQN